jgi:hypothetical protein
MEATKMNRLVTLAVAMFGLVSTCAAQFHPCQFTEPSGTERKESVSISRVSLIEPNGEIHYADTFIPDSTDLLPGIVFSHSAIHGPNNNADMHQFALALARAGAASVVLEGVLEWQIPNDESVRDPHLMACAGQWLLLHAKLDRRRLAVAGAMGRWGGGDTPWCQLGESPCFHGNALWLNFGQTTPAESHNTDAMLTFQGRLRMAQFAQEHLKLKAINPRWVSDGSTGSSE